MGVVASLIVRNEINRYLKPCLKALEWCDEILVWDDNSDDGTTEWLMDSQYLVLPHPSLSFKENEGAARQAFLEVSLAMNPDWILNIDADEFVSDGPAIKECLEHPQPAVWRLCMSEVWRADEDALFIRQDGGWRPHEAPILWSPSRVGNVRQIPARELASGRVPQGVLQANGRRYGITGEQIFHFGWTNPEERAARYARYAEQDAGRFHANSHIQSIMWPDSRIRTCRQEWPEWLGARKEEILKGAL